MLQTRRTAPGGAATLTAHTVTVEHLESGEVGVILWRWIESEQCWLNIGAEAFAPGQLCLDDNDPVSYFLTSWGRLVHRDVLDNVRAPF